MRNVMSRNVMVLVLVVVGAASAVPAQQPQTAATGEIQILPVQGNVYMFAGAGGNISVSTGFDGTLLVDAGRADMAEKVLANVQQLAAMVQIPYFPLAPCVGPRCAGGAGTGAYVQRGWTSQALNGITNAPAAIKPLRYVIDTNADPDHTGGNARIAAAGVTFTGGNVAREAAGQGAGAEVWAHQAVLNRMQKAKVPVDVLPQWTYFTEKYKWNGFFNGEGIELIHIPAAHSDGDTIVYFRYSDVISAGDVFAIDLFPRIEVERGGTIQGTIDGLNRMLDIAIPQSKTQGGTYIIPGHGRICDTGDLVNYRNMVVKVRDRVEDLMKSGMTVQQVKAAKPSLDFDGRYGSPNAFIEAIYATLNRAK
jgi:cyclase